MKASEVSIHDNNAYLNARNPFLAHHQANKYHRNMAAPYKRPCFNRSVRYIQQSQGASNATPVYIPRSLGTPENRMEFQRFHHRPPSHSQPGAGYHRQGNIPRIAEGFSALSAGDNDNALKIAKKILKTNSYLNRRNYLRVHQLKARALLNSGRIDECLQSIEQVKPPLDKGLLMTKGRALQAKNRLCEALLVFKDLYKNHSEKDKDKKLNYLALGVLYQRMGEYQKALTIFKKLRTDLFGHEDTPCDDKEIELAIGRLYQDMGRYQEALTIFKMLRSYTDLSGHEDTPCNDKDIELTLGRQYQLMGRYQEALTTFIKLRTDLSGHEDTPCKDKEIELAIGRLYKNMGLNQEALTVFIKLRIDFCGHEDTPCNDKDIELTLGRQYQLMGRYQEAHTIFIKLRTDRSGHEGTPCNDREIELALGRLYEDMGLYQEALTIFIRLRTDRSGHEGTPCYDKEVELALGNIHIYLMNWHQFDQMQLDDKGFAGPEVDLCISVRYFRECISSGQDKEISGLMAKAIEHVCNAIEKSQYLDASSFRQLGHCLRIAALLPIGKAPDLFSKDELTNLVSNCFARAIKLAPNRQDRLKTEDWRKTERAFLAKLSPG